MRTKFELADVVRLFGANLASKTKLSPLVLTVLTKIANCRTIALGGHQETCDNCGTDRYSYNSCGDRHCPLPRRILQVIPKPIPNVDLSIT